MKLQPNKLKRLAKLRKNTAIFGGGSMSRPALEREAWDMAPSGWNNDLRDAALDTYKAERKGGAEVSVGGKLVGAGIGIPLLLRLASRGRVRI